MNILILSLLTVVSAVPASDQKPAGNPARINACAVLTRETIAKVMTAANKPLRSTPPAETPVGPHGSSCDYNSIAWQIDPFANADSSRKSPSKSWVPVSGVGETAYFNNVSNFFAELFVWSGSHHFVINMEVKPGSTAEQLKPGLIQLANLIIPKLK
jgi:hypothetical protein